MKRKLTALSRQYVAVLRKHLREGPRASLQPAYDLGCQAAALDLETLDMARIHKRALAALEASSSRDGDFFCRVHHPHREDASRRAQGQRPLASAQPDAEPAHGGPGGFPAVPETGHRPAQDRGAGPQKKRATLAHTFEGIAPPADAFAMPDPPDSFGAGGQANEDQPRVA